MIRMTGNGSEDLGRRAFGTAGGWGMPSESPGRVGKGIDLEEENLQTPVVSRAPRAWKPRTNRIYNFPVRRVVEEK